MFCSAVFSFICLIREVIDTLGKDRERGLDRDCSWYLPYPFFYYLYHSWDSRGKNTEMVCHSLLQWTTFCQNSLLWPIRLGWPYMSWLIASLSYPSPFAMTRLWSIKGEWLLSLYKHGTMSKKAIPQASC